MTLPIVTIFKKYPIYRTGKYKILETKTKTEKKENLVFIYNLYDIIISHEYKF